MNGLFIDLYLDEDVDVLVADLVRARGFTVVTTQEAGNIGASDRQQLDAARTCSTPSSPTTAKISSCLQRSTLSRALNIAGSSSRSVGLRTRSFADCWRYSTMLRQMK